MEQEVKLFGAWPSPFSYRVIWVLELKGIKYEYIEEDLQNKSDLLLQYNPVYKKIPVIVHGGKPIAEFMVIIQYIEETWPENCPLLPKDPYEKAIARFWIKFAEDKGSSIWTLYRSVGEAQEKATRDSLEMLRILEEHGLGEKKFFGGDSIGLADIALGGIAHWLEVLEEILGLKIFEAHKFPRLNLWMKDFKDDPIIKENLPNCDEMLAIFKLGREKIVSSRIVSSTLN